MELKVLSASAYTTDSWCRFKLYLQRILGFVDESGAAAIQGTICHKFLEILAKAAKNKHPKGSKIFNYPYLWSICVNHFYSKFPEQCSKIDTKKLEKCAKGVISLLNTEDNPANLKILGIETSFYIPLKDKVFLMPDGNYFSVNGRIDLVTEIDKDTIEVTDYKSGSDLSYEKPGRPVKDSLSLLEDIQPRLYHLAVRQLFPQYPNVLIKFIYFTCSGAITTIMTDDDIPNTIEMIKRKYLAIKADQTPQRNISWKCKAMCSHWKTGICNQVWSEVNTDGYEFVTQKYKILNFKGKK